MAAQVEVQTGEVGRTGAGGRLHLSPLTDSSNKNMIEIPSVSEPHIITSESNKPAPSPKPRLTPKPFAVEKNPTIKPILAPKPQTKPRPESTRIAGSKPDPPNTPKPTARLVSTNPNRPAATSFRTPNRLKSGQTTKPVIQPFKPAPPIDCGEPSKSSRPVPPGRQKPAASSLAYSKSLKTYSAAEWSGTTSHKNESGESKEGSIKRAKSMDFLVAIGRDEEERNKAHPEAAVQLRTQPRRPRPVSAIFPTAQAKTETPVPAPRWVARRPLSVDLTSKFESIGLSLHRKSPKANTPTEQEPPQDTEQDETPSGATLEGNSAAADPAHSDQNDKKAEESATKDSEESKPATSIRSRISLLLDSSSAPGAAADLPSPAQPVPEGETSVGVKRLIKQLTEDTTPTPVPAVKPAPKPRPLPLDLTKKFSSECLPEAVSLTEAADRHETGKDPQRGAEESTSTPNDHKMFLDLKNSPSEFRKVLIPEGSEAGQLWAPSKDSGSGAELHTVRASLFENIVERQSVFMMDQDESASTPKDSPGSPFLMRRTDEDDGSLVTATYKGPASPSAPFWVSHTFDTVQAAEENRAVSESVPTAQWEDKAATLRFRRSERARPCIQTSDPAQTQPASTAAPDPQTRYLRVGALQKWTTTGFDQGGGLDKGTPQESERKGQVALDKDQEEVAAAPKRLKMLQGEEQQKPRATYFALTGQMQELASPGGGGTGFVGASLHFDDLSVRSALGGSQGQIFSARRNPSLEEAFGQISPSQERLDEFMPRNHVPSMEFRSQMDEQTKEDTPEVKKKKEQQMEAERHVAKINELEREKQKHLEMEKQAQLDFERMKEWERQREFERQRQKAFEKEKKDLEEKRHRLKLPELEKQKQQESERERQRQLQKEKLELERQKEKEREREKEKQKEMEMHQLVELERQRLREKAEKEAEKLRQMALEQEMLKIRELEKRAKQREMEIERRRELEKQRQIEVEKEKRQQDMERQQLEKERLRREQEQERKRNEELERLKEMERQQVVELEKQRLREKEEKLRQMALEQEMLRIRELEKERERQKELEMERQLEIKVEKERELEKRRQRQLDMERQQLENERLRREQEQVRKRKEEMERMKEMERQQLVELEKQRLREKEEKEAERLRQMALEQEMLKIKELEKERAKQRELEMEHQMEMREQEKRRQREVEKEKQRQLDLERQQFENERLRREQEKDRQRKELERLKEAELEKLKAKEKMEKAEAEKMRHIAKQQEAERQRLKEKQRKEEQERLWLESSALRPTVLDLDSFLRTDHLSPSSPQHSDPSPRWREPYKPAILDIDSFTSHTQGSPGKELFPASGVLGLDAEFGVRSLPTPERDVNWKVPPQTSVGFLSPAWTSSPQDPWELRPVEMSVDKPVMEPQKAANKLSPEQLLLKQEERLPSPQRHRPPFLDDPLFLSHPSGKEQQTRIFPHEPPHSSLGEQVWIPREPQPPKERNHRRSQGSQELNRMRSRSMSRRSVPSSSIADGALLRMRSRSAHREQDLHSSVKQKQSGEADSGTPVQDTDSQYGTWETGLRTDDSLTPATPSSESNLSPSPRKPTPLPSPGVQASQLETTTTDGPSPSSSSESQPLNFPDAPATLLDNSALRSRAQLGKKRAPRTRPSKAARLSAVPALGDGGNTEDWLYRDSTEAKAESKNDDSESEDQAKGADAGPAVPAQPQRVALFPGVDPSALKAQLKKRSDSDNQTDGPVPSPSQPSRSPKSPFLPRAARVLPPPGGKENGQEDSPQWLKELKSKKRLSHYENES